MKKITARKIAAMAGVSPATVSRALNNSPLVEVQTRSTILEIARKTGFTLPHDLKNPTIAVIGDSVESIPVANPYLEHKDMECGLSYWGGSGLAYVALGGRLTLRSGDSIVKTFDLPGDGRFVPVYADSDIAVLRDLDSEGCLVTDWTASIRSDAIFPPDRRIMRIGGRTTPIVTDGKDTFRVSMRGIEKTTGKLVLDAGILEWDHGIAVVRMD